MQGLPVANNIYIATQEIKILIYPVAQKMSQTLCNYNGTYTLWRKISFCEFVDHYVILSWIWFQIWIC